MPVVIVELVLTISVVFNLVIVALVPTILVIVELVLTKSVLVNLVIVPVVIVPAVLTTSVVFNLVIVLTPVSYTHLTLPTNREV